MNISLRQRTLCIIITTLLITVSSLAGCGPSGNTGANGDMKIIAGYIEETQNFTPDLLNISDWSKTTIEAIKSYVDSDNKTLSDAQKINQYMGMIDGHLLTVKNCESSVKNYESEVAKISSIDGNTMAAVKEYFVRMESSLGSLQSVLMFFQSVQNSWAPLNSLSSSFTDENTMLNAYQRAVKEWEDNLSKVECPSYMKYAYAKYTKTVGLFDELLEYRKNAVLIGDTVRDWSAYFMYESMMNEEINYRLMLYDDIQMQFEKVGERLKGSIALLGKELIEASKASNQDLGSYKYTYQQNKYDIDINYNAVNTIYPSLYKTMDSIINLTGISDNGNVNILIRAEIPGFTQVYEQMVTLTPQMTQFFVHPPMLTGDLDLSSARDAQIKLKITNFDSNSPILVKDIPIEIKSRNDVFYENNDFIVGFGTCYNFLPFLSPEEKSIVDLKRTAIDELIKMTSNKQLGVPSIDFFGGYTGISGYANEDVTKYQVLALQKAMSDMGVRYNKTVFSSSDATQRVAYPEEVLSTKSGICIETSLLMASALQSAGMHCLLIFPTGHAQVAVETWEGSGEYFLIETTILPVKESNQDMIVQYMTRSQWYDYINSGTDGRGCYVVDCGFAKLLNYLAK
jgi:hypothetical protein